MMDPRVDFGVASPAGNPPYPRSSMFAGDSLAAFAMRRLLVAFRAISALRTCAACRLAALTAHLIVDQQVPTGKMLVGLRPIERSLDHQRITTGAGWTGLIVDATRVSLGTVAAGRRAPD
jgi:hypothetical protein